MDARWDAQILAEEAAWPNPDHLFQLADQNSILAEEAAWPNPDSRSNRMPPRTILAEEAAWPNPDDPLEIVLRALS